MRRFLVVPLLVFTAFALVPSAGAATTAPYCGIRWGSLAKHADGFTGSPVTNVRSGRHDCFDRLVVDLAGPVGGYRVKYVSQVVEDGSGRPIPLAGGAFLRVVVLAPAYDENGSTYSPADPAHLVNVGGYRTFRQVAWAGSFEGQTTLGLGVRARLPFRVFKLNGPGAGSRIVVDVAHRW
jgi:hypothetical protein